MSRSTVKIMNSPSGDCRLFLNGVEFESVRRFSMERDEGCLVLNVSLDVVFDDGPIPVKPSDIEQLTDYLRERFHQHADATQEMRVHLMRLSELVTKLISKVSIMNTNVNNLDSVIQQQRADIARETDVVTSATTLIRAQNAALLDAINKAKQAGATDAQLQSFTELHNSQTTNLDSLAQAVAENTVAAPGGGSTTSAGGTTGNTAPGTGGASTTTGTAGT
jgi:hypothetical protein